MTKSDLPSAESLAADDPARPPSTFWMPQDRLGELIARLWERGYRVIGPRVDSDAIVYGEIRDADELPRGWTEEQSAGRYRLRRRDDEQSFGYNVGPHSWKSYLFPPKIVVGSAERRPEGWHLEDAPDDSPAFAFLGVRACELEAIAVQDRVMMHSEHIDPIYAERRRRAFIVAANCTQAAETCFCTSMDSGPRCRSGFDLALTELADASGFTLEPGSPSGRSLVDDLGLQPADPPQIRDAASARDQAVHQIRKRLDTTDIRDLLLDNLDHPRWDDVASRCLSCTNCTMVCPTCFCCSVHDVSDLDGDRVRRVRQWDSCFDGEISYMNGALVRKDIRSRYRQWLTHKLASWLDQFDQSGCVGCGRCITWCPVGIDLTEEVAAIRGQEP